ncbi:MAG: hypothetical protein ABMA26_09470 [Limisphaerales bacterium]
MKPTEFPCWIEGEVDSSKEHAEVWWGDGKEPVALVGAPIAGSYVVEFLPVPEGPRCADAIAVVKKNLTFELGRCTPTDPWGHIRECCKETGSGLGGPARWVWSDGHRAEKLTSEVAARACRYSNLIQAYADWLPHRDAGDSEERRYFENRWRAYSKAFGISLSLDEPDAVRVRTKVQSPKAYLSLIERAARSYGQTSRQSNDCFSGVLEAPEAFCRLYERYALRIQKADRNRLKAEEKLRTVLMATCCDAVKILYGRQKKPVTVTDLKACGIDAVPCPASLESPEPLKTGWDCWE